MTVTHFPLERLAAALRADGVAVGIMSGAQGRSARMFSSRGFYVGCQASCAHHTGSSGNNPGGDISYILNGKGEGYVISNSYTARSGFVTLIASGPTYTEGAGGPLGIIPANRGNDVCFSNEIAGGLGPGFPAVQQRAALLLHRHVNLIAADVFGWPDDPFSAHRLFAHHEWAPGRKVDPKGDSDWAVGYEEWDMDMFRIDARLAGSPPPGEDMIYLKRSDRQHDSRAGYHQLTSAPQKRLKPGENRKIELGMASVAAVRVTVDNAKGPGFVSITGDPGIGDPTVNIWNGSNGDGTTIINCPTGHGYVATTVECDVVVDVFGRG